MESTMESDARTQIKLHQLLTTLKVNSENYITLYVKPSSFPYYINELSLAPPHSIYADEIKEAVGMKAITQGIEKYNTGAAIYWPENGNKYIVLPPFPITEDKITIGEIDTSLLCTALEDKYIIGIVLVTWGTYSIGIFDQGNLMESKTGTGHIHKEHKKGGSSAKRFARRTEEQRKDFLRKVSNRIDERFKDHKIDYIFFGGNRLILKPLLKECKCPELAPYKISDRILDVRHANKDALTHSLHEITKSVVFTFCDYT